MKMSILLISLTPTFKRLVLIFNILKSSSSEWPTIVLFLNIF